MSFVLAKEILVKYLSDLDSFTKLVNGLNVTQETRDNMTRMWPVNETQFMEMVQPFMDGSGNPYTNGTNMSIALPSASASTNNTMIPSLKVFFYSLYIFIFIIGMIGNVIVCYVVLRNKHMQTVTNIFIMNLALSDILLCLLGIPLTVIYLITLRHWVFGTLMCHLLPAAQGISIYISAFTLMAIAIDRYFVILYPFRPRMAVKTCALIIFFIWFSGSCLTFPYGWYMTLSKDGDLYFCQENWGSVASKYAFGFTTSTLQFVIPFGIISFCYIRVCLKLSERSQNRPGAPSARREELDRERTKKTNRMLIGMVIIFGFAWLPLNIHNLIQDFYEPAATWEHGPTFFLFAHAFAMSSACYNPFLYAWMNENFRKEFKQLLPCFVNSTTRQESINRRTMIGIDPRAGGRPARTSDENQSPKGSKAAPFLPPGQSSFDYPPISGGFQQPEGDESVLHLETDCNGQEMIPLQDIQRKIEVLLPQQHVPKITTTSSSVEQTDVSTKTSVTSKLPPGKMRISEAGAPIKEEKSKQGRRPVLMNGHDGPVRMDEKKKRSKGKDQQDSFGPKSATAAVYVPSSDSVHLRSIPTHNNNNNANDNGLGRAEQTV